MKVLIVGAGIAGPTLAYWLLRGGHEPTLVEWAPELRRGGYLVDFWGAGFDVAEQMGIVPELRRRGYLMTEARAVDHLGHRVASLKPSAIMGSTQRYVSIARSDLATVIYEALGGAVELILDDTVHALEDDGDRVRVTFGTGQARDFDLVVGVDGLHSRVRRLAFGPDQGLELMPRAGTFYFDSVSQIRMPAWTRGRVALVGDAAACPSFPAGQGSALAMVESYTLAAELSRGSDHREAFARYHERLAPLLRSKQEAAVGLGAAFAPTSTLQVLLRNTVMRFMGLPKVADLAMGKSFRDAVELPTFAAA